MKFYIYLCAAILWQVHSFSTVYQSAHKANPRAHTKFVPNYRRTNLKGNPLRSSTSETTAVPITFKSIIQSFSRKGAIESSSTQWGLYGRVPYDDALFTTTRLSNPDLYRRSFVEAIGQEKPIVDANYARVQYVRLFTSAYLVVVPFIAVFCTLIYLFLRNPAMDDKFDEMAVRGFYSGISAVRKEKPPGTDDADPSAGAAGGKRSHKQPGRRISR